MLIMNIDFNRHPYLFIYGLLVLIGVGGFYSFYVNFLHDYYSAKQWEPASCLVEKSSLLIYTGHSRRSRPNTYNLNSQTYKIFIQYKYEYQGEWYKGNRYRFFDFYSAGKLNKEKIIQAHPVGSSLTCYIDPLHPEKSVINREEGLFYVILILLIPCVLVFVGMGGIYSILKEDQDTNTAMGMITLSEVSPFKKFLTAIMMGMFWNAITSFFVVVYWVPLYIEKGSFLFFESLFFAPFVIIGILLLINIFYQLMTLFNPNTTITINSSSLHPGGHYRLNFYTDGRTDLLTSFSITLVGKSIEKIQKDKATTLKETVFYEGKIYQQDNGEIIPYGLADFDLPEDIKPSAIQGNIEIKWVINVKGKIRFWPDVDNEYPVKVAPLSK